MLITFTSDTEPVSSDCQLTSKVNLHIHNAMQLEGGLSYACNLGDFAALDRTII